MLPIRTLPQLLLERAAENPSRLVERHKHRGIWRQYTYADLLDNVRAFALGLHADQSLGGDFALGLSARALALAPALGVAIAGEMQKMQLPALQASLGLSVGF